MKPTLVLVLLIFLMTSCKEDNQTVAKQNETIEATNVVNEVAANRSDSKPIGDALCNINGEDWVYTKASGIVSTHAKTKERTSMVTFKKKLDKGSESIQLTYNADSFELIDVSVQLRQIKKDGSLFTCYYRFNQELKERFPECEISGTLDLSDAVTLSGTAEIKNLPIRHEKESLKNNEDAIITITDLKFTDVGYSDIDKFTNAYKKKD